MPMYEYTRRRTQRRANMQRIVPKIMPGVWNMGVRLPSEDYVNRALYNHYEDVLNNAELNDREAVDLDDAKDVSKLVELLSTHHDTSVEDFGQLIAAQKWQWLKLNSNSSETLEHAIHIAIRLSLFCKPTLKDAKLTLKEVVRDTLPSWNPDTISDPVRLRADFSARTLTRGRIIRIVYTSYLSEHLTFVGKTNLRIFRHVSALNEHKLTATGLIYPTGFLQETTDTIRLLYPGGRKSEKRRRKICRSEDADLEAQMASHDVFDLTNYRFWRHRLAYVQKVFENSSPKTVKQRWFDRREVDKWTALWTAVIAIILTVIFSVISAVTGILQTYVAFHPKKQ